MHREGTRHDLTNYMQVRREAGVENWEVLTFIDNGQGIPPAQHNEALDLEPPEGEQQKVALNGDGSKMAGFYLKEPDGIMVTFSNYVAADGQVHRSCAMLAGESRCAQASFLELPPNFPIDGSQGLDELLGTMAGDQQAYDNTEKAIKRFWCGKLNMNGVFIGNRRSYYTDLAAILNVSLCLTGKQLLLGHPQLTGILQPRGYRQA